MRYVGLILALIACRRTLPLPTYEDGQALFPLKTGLTWIYLVQETTYTTLGAVPHRYFLRLRVDTLTRDAYNRPSYYVLWDSSYSGTSWSFWQAGLAYRDTAQAELWEDNRRYLILRFPVSPFLRWNRHAYTNLPPEYARYAHLDTTYTLDQRHFPSSVIVLRREDTLSLLQKAYFFEVYARGRGLIHRYERLDAYDLSSNGTLVRRTDSYYREWRLVGP
ncbi:MAG: hypothetical protein NZ958_03910 [Bacteroidia bacterium]|nr:hypothetical protein [Bacteroidia bacterium]MDW8088364.1 hypothetical protein [Bacteroidia bacterium]